MLDKKYDAGGIEANWQERWRKDNIFSFDRNSGKVYSIDTPPPFTSGTLHMGHIYNHVWIDLAARYRRMRGFSVYLPQGFDCHGLPTELAVEKELGVPKENRGEFIRKCVEWTESAISRMKNQFDSIGYSTDWSYTYRTMDSDYKLMVQKTLLIFYGKKMLYREKHPILWCPNCETALAKAEVGYIEKEGKLYHIDLDVDGSKLTIATTRPEMMPACVAVFVHPDDDRYTRFVGKKARLPIFDREVPIIADDAVDMDFGTGIVYLCTFGDEQDIAWQKHYSLPVIEAIDDGGRMTDAAGKYAGLTAKEARERIVEDIGNAGLMRKVEDIVHNVTCHTERGSCKAPIELLPKEQWFIRVKDYTGDIVEAAKKMSWYPGYMLRRLVDWSESMDWDWIISRQRVFGTPIPFWVCGCGNVIPAGEDELPVDPRGTTRKCNKCGGEAQGEVDVCDCWVDSSITPLRISRWGVDDDFFKKTYPSTLRPQGYEIIRTWAFYTIFRGLILTGKPCFGDLLINGMVAGPDGRKMSKSLGNIIEPEEPLRKYSADALRQWAAGGSLGDDYPFSWEECEHSQKFLTKLWNVSRFIEIHLKDYGKPSGKRMQRMKFSVVDLWILSRLHNLIGDCTGNLEKYVFNIPLQDVRSFVWHDLADYYLELVKHRLYKPDVYGVGSREAARYTLRVVLENVLLMLSPFVPHICDEIWSHVVDGKMLASTSGWPDVDGILDLVSSKSSASVGELISYGDLICSIVSDVRKHKSENNLSLGAELERVKVQAGEDVMSMIDGVREDLMGACKIKNLEVVLRKEGGYSLVF